MGVYVTLANGLEAKVSASMGGSVREVIERLTADSLTGSAVTLDQAPVMLADGSTVSYGNVIVWENRSDG